MSCKRKHASDVLSLEQLTLLSIIGQCHDTTFLRRVRSKVHTRESELDKIEMNRWHSEMAQLSSYISVHSIVRQWRKLEGCAPSSLTFTNHKLNNSFTISRVVMHTKKAIHIRFVKPSSKNAAYIDVPVDTKDDGKLIQLLADKTNVSVNDAQHIFYIFYSRE